ncbi:MAG: hypothetical protein ACTSSP_04035 [Candidatus Asgardarchaeia archaeon]
MKNIIRQLMDKAVNKGKRAENAKPNDKVRCISNFDNNYGGCAAIELYLTVGKTYTIERVESHSSHTKMFLQEFPNIPFNSTHFRMTK